MSCAFNVYTNTVVLYVNIYVCSPGMNSDDDLDDKVIECCTNADVFVYVANGIATFETSVRSSPHAVLCVMCCMFSYTHPAASSLMHADCKVYTVCYSLLP